MLSSIHQILSKARKIGPVVAFVSGFCVISIARAADVPLASCSKLIGTYLLSRTEIDSLTNEDIIRQDIITIAPAGLMFFTKGYVGSNSPTISEGKGRWACISSNKMIVRAQATVLYFDYNPEPPGLHRDDYLLFLNINDQSLTGTVTLRYFHAPDNPLPPPVTRFTGPIDFVGARVYANGPRE